jgi:hypothetical protein
MMWGVRAGLWALFALCLIASGLLLLPACGVGLPLHLSMRLQSTFCPVPLDRAAFLRASEERQAKEARIRKAEIEIARIARCAPEGPVASPPARPTGRT